jgi:hypothetical protein
VANPWTKKNPFLSMWLSGANAAAGTARAAGTAEAKRQQTRLIEQTSRFWLDTWLGAAQPKPKRPRKGR